MKDLNDELLIGQFQNGDGKAFRLLANRWHTRIFRFAYGYFGNRAEADEIAQKTLINVYQNLLSLDNPNAFSSWIYRIANNLCLDELKRAGRRKTDPLNLIDPEMQADEHTPAEELEVKERNLLIQKALQKLPDDQRVVVVLKEFEALKFREIAEVLNISENTAKTRMYAGLKRLGAVLENWNIQNEYLNYD